MNRKLWIVGMTSLCTGASLVAMDIGRMASINPVPEKSIRVQRITLQMSPAKPIAKNIHAMPEAACGIMKPTKPPIPPPISRISSIGVNDWQRRQSGTQMSRNSKPQKRLRTRLMYGARMNPSGKGEGDANDQENRQQRLFQSLAPRHQATSRRVLILKSPKYRFSLRCSYSSEGSRIIVQKLDLNMSAVLRYYRGV